MKNDSNEKSNDSISKKQYQNKIFPLTKDIVFKAFFTDISNKDLLLDFLNHYLDLDIKNIDDIQIVNPELTPKHSTDKRPRLDLRVKTINNENINVEVEVRNRNNSMIDRSIYYTSKLLTEQLEISKGYETLGKAISLNVLDFNIFTDEEYLTSYVFKEKTKSTILSDKMQIYFLELKKYNNKLENNKKDFWTILFKTTDLEVLEMLKSENKVMNKAVDSLVKISNDERIRFAIEMYEKQEHDIITEMNYNRRIGHEQGIKEGVEQGIKQGKVDSIKKMLRNNLDDETIKSVFDMDDEELDEIKKNMKL